MSKNKTIIPRHICVVILNIGLLLLVVGAALPITLLVQSSSLSYKIIFSIGAAATLIARLFMPAPDNEKVSLRRRRLLRLESWSAIMYATAAFFMFYNPSWAGTTDWIVFTLAGAFLQLYCNFMLARLNRKKA